MGIYSESEGPYRKRFEVSDSIVITPTIGILLSCKSKEIFQLLAVFLHSSLYPLLQLSIYHICPEGFHVRFKIRYIRSYSDGVYDGLHHYGEHAFSVEDGLEFPMLPIEVE